MVPAITVSQEVLDVLWLHVGCLYIDAVEGSYDNVVNYGHDACASNILILRPFSLSIVNNCRRNLVIAYKAYNILFDGTQVSRSAGKAHQPILRPF